MLKNKKNQTVVEKIPYQNEEAIKKIEKHYKEELEKKAKKIKEVEEGLDKINNEFLKLKNEITLTIRELTRVQTEIIDDADKLNKVFDEMRKLTDNFEVESFKKEAIGPSYALDYVKGLLYKVKGKLDENSGKTKTIADSANRSVRIITDLERIMGRGK